MTSIITVGTVPRDAACYIPRTVDIDLLKALWQGRYCSVLTSSQTGKNSLLTRTAARLRTEGIARWSRLIAIGQDLFRDDGSPASDVQNVLTKEIQI